MARLSKKSSLQIPPSWLEGTILPHRGNEKFHWAIEYKTGDKSVRVLLPQTEAWNFDVEAKLKVWFELDVDGTPRIKRRQRNNKRYVVV